MKRCENRLLKKTCARCYERKARVRRAGSVVWLRENVLCFQCARSTQDQARSVGFARGQAIRGPSITSAALEPQPFQCLPLITPGYTSNRLFSPDAQKAPGTPYLYKSLTQEAQ